MCRMIAIRNYRQGEHGDLLESFSLLAEQGKVPPGSLPGHNDGWGFGYYRSGKAVMHKSASSILRDKGVLHRLIREADGSPTVLVHIRKSAWPNTSTAANAHPFLFNNFMFAHNGTIRNYKDLLPSLNIDKKHAELTRALDTEIFFYYILSRMGPDIEKALRRSVRQIMRDCAFSSLNFVLTTEKGLFAYRQYSHDPSYYSLYHARARKADVICSEPIGKSLSWKMLRKGSLLAI